MIVIFMMQTRTRVIYDPSTRKSVYLIVIIRRNFSQNCVVHVTFRYVINLFEL